MWPATLISQDPVDSGSTQTQPLVRRRASLVLPNPVARFPWYLHCHFWPHFSATALEMQLQREPAAQPGLPTWTWLSSTLWTRPCGLSWWGCGCVVLGPEWLLSIPAAGLYRVPLRPGLHLLWLGSQTGSLGETPSRNRANLKFLLLQKSSTAVWALLRRAELGNETLWCEVLAAVGRPGVAEVYFHCSWKGGGWQWEKGADELE